MAVDKKSGVDYQQRALEFHVGDVVYLATLPSDQSGRVIAVWPAIGMVDVQYPEGEKRIAVETLMKYVDANPVPPLSVSESIPGGISTVPVNAGPVVQRAARRFTKEALYWASVDRRYKANNEEKTSASYLCPKCKTSELRPAIYKRREGKSLRLLGCPVCMFLIKQDDIIERSEVENGEG